MAIYIQKDSEEKYPVDIAEEIESQVCFYCGEHLFDDPKRSTGGVILWQGITGLIVLHQPCAEVLSIHLIQDARTLTTKVKNSAKLGHDMPIDASDLWYTK